MTAGGRCSVLQTTTYLPTYLHTYIHTYVHALKGAQSLGSVCVAVYGCDGVRELCGPNYWRWFSVCCATARFALLCFAGTEPNMAPRNEERLPPRPTLLSIPSFAKSFKSYQSSFEADDERSTSESDAMSPRTSIENGERGEGRYPAEDRRPTTSKELAGW